jgi:ribosomal protein S18 acetylase RimI-like enzyme
MSSADVTIRRAGPNDADAVRAVFDAAVAQGWTHLGGLEREPLFDGAQWGELVTAHLGDDVLLLAVDAVDHILGFCAVHPGDGELYLLFVHPAASGRGVGRTLLEAGHDVLRAAGRREAFLFTQAQNARALAVYTAAGYRPDGGTRASDFRGTPLREVRLRMDITRPVI